MFDELEENLTIVHEDMQMIQPLFKIQRQSIKNVSLKECITKVVRYFRNDIDGKIATNLDKIGDDLVIRTNAGLILQILINLIDNAIYWLGKSGNPDKNIYFAISPANRTLIVGDNGNGI